MPQVQLMKMTKSLFEEFFNRIKISAKSDCWEWTGTFSGTGYGKIMLNGVLYSSHRLSYSLFFGEIKNGLYICHSCDNRKCVNPAHLWAGTQSDNLWDMSAKGRNVQQKKTHCPKGHEYSKENIYIRKNRNGRECKECLLINSRKKYYRNRLKILEYKKMKYKERNYGPVASE